MAPSPVTLGRLPEVPGQLMSDPGAAPSHPLGPPEGCEPLASHLTWKAGAPRILGPFVSIALFFLTPSHTLPYVVGAGLLAVVLALSLRVRPEENG